MKPGVLNHLCAHPVAIAWTLGAGALDTAVLIAVSREVSLPTLLGDVQAALLLVCGLIPATLLGYFAGVFAIWPWLRPLCARLNGAPFKAGDRVVVLAGPLRGTSAPVADVTASQGGWDVVWLDLEPVLRRKPSHLFEEYALFRIHSPKADGSHPASAKEGGAPGLADDLRRLDSASR